MGDIMNEKFSGAAIFPKGLRGQASTEYLIILAVVIVVALVVVGILGWFPGLGGGIRESASQSYWKSATPFSISEYRVTAAGNVTLTMQNVLEQSVSVTLISFNNLNTTFSPAIDFGSGDKRVVQFNLTQKSCPKIGDSFSYTVRITYDTENIPGNQQIGDKPLVGKCT